MFCIIGSNGVEVESIPIPERSTDVESTWKTAGIVYELINIDTVTPNPGFVVALRTHFRAWALLKKPSSGGDGGCRGFGGSAGKLHAIGLLQIPKFSISLTPGLDIF